MRANPISAQLGSGQGQRLGELGANVRTVVVRRVEELRQVLGTDHVPWTRERLDDIMRIDQDVHRSGNPGRGSPHGCRQIAMGPIRRCQRGDRVPGRLPRCPCRVGIARPRHGQHVAAAMIDGLKLALGTVGALHDVPGRSRDRFPSHRHLPSPTLGTNAGRRGERPGDAGHNRVATAIDASFPIKAGSRPPGFRRRRFRSRHAEEATLSSANCRERWPPRRAAARCTRALDAAEPVWSGPARPPFLC